MRTVAKWLTGRLLHLIYCWLEDDELHRNARRETWFSCFIWPRQMAFTFLGQTLKTFAIPCLIKPAIILNNCLNIIKYDRKEVVSDGLVTFIYPKMGNFLNICIYFLTKWLEIEIRSHLVPKGGSNSKIYLNRMINFALEVERHKKWDPISSCFWQDFSKCITDFRKVPIKSKCRR